MSEVSYSNVPPMMAAIKSGDIEAIRSLLHAGHSPNEPQCYQVMIGDWPRDDEASPLELAVLENRMDMVQLLIECGADLTHNPEELLCGSLRSQDLTLFSFLVDVGVRIPATQRDICRLFLHLVDRDEPNVLPILKRMGMDLKQYGGEALRSMASHGNQLLVEYLDLCDDEHSSLQAKFLHALIRKFGFQPWTLGVLVRGTLSMQWLEPAKEFSRLIANAESLDALLAVKHRFSAYLLSEENKDPKFRAIAWQSLLRAIWGTSSENGGSKVIKSAPKELKEKYQQVFA